MSLSVPKSRSLQESMDQYTLIQLPYHQNTPLPRQIKEIDILKKRSQHHQWEVSLFQSMWVSYRRSMWADKPKKRSFPFATKTNSSREQERKARSRERIVFCQEIQNFRKRVTGKVALVWIKLLVASWTLKFSRNRLIDIINNSSETIFGTTIQ